MQTGSKNQYFGVKRENPKVSRNGTGTILKSGVMTDSALHGLSCEISK